MSEDWLDDKEVLTNKIKEMPAEEKMSYLAELANAQVTLQDAISRMEDDLKELNKQLVKVSHFEIPKMMGDLGMTGFTLSNGMKVSVRPFYTGRITDEKAYVWLIERGHGDLIKAQVIIEYGAGDSDQIKRLAEVFEENEIEFEDKRSIHHMTLGAFIREQAEAGTPVDDKLFNVYSGFKTSIK